MRSLSQSRLTRKLRLVAALALAGLGPLPVGAATVAWIDWYAKTPTGVLGTIRQGNETVEVSFLGPYSEAFTDALPEPYWGPAATYKSSAIPNAPPNSDIIFIPGGPDPLRLSFSQALVSPIFAIASLGLKTADGSVSLTGSMAFDRPVSVLSNGPNYYAGGLFSNFGVNGNTLTGVESSGTVRLDGGGTEIAWTSPREEVGGVLVGTYGFTLGVDCSDYRIGPATLGTAGAVPGGCRGYNDRSFAQQAVFEVRGRFDNRPGGRWVQGEAFTLAANGRFSNNALFIIGEDQTFTSHGQFLNGSSEGGGLLDVRGTLKVASNGAVNFGALTLKGDNNLGSSGRLLIQPGARFTSTGTVSLEPGAQAEVGGLFDNSGGQVEVDALDARLAVGATGTLATSGRVAVGTGQLRNQGLLRVDSGGVLLLKEGLALGDSGGLQLDNQAQLSVLSGGRLHIDGSTDPAAVVGLYGRARNGASGTMQLDGDLLLSGQLDNAGMVRLSRSGTMTLSGAFATFAQATDGQLQAQGRIELNNASRMQLSGISFVPGRLQIGDGSRIAVQPDGDLTFAPLLLAVESGLLNNGRLINQGKTALVSGSVGATADHQNNGRIDNSGLFRIGSGALLTQAGEVNNSGRFQIDAGGTLFMADGGVGFFQAPSGVLANNGSVTGASLNELIIFGGRVTGSGTWNTSSVSFGELSFEPGEEDLSLQRTPLGDARLLTRAALAPLPYQPGTAHFTGDLRMQASSTLRLRFSENGGNDRLIVDGQLLANAGARMEWLFAGGSTPGLDQVFTYFESPNTVVGAFALSSPAGVEVSELDLGASALGRQQRGLVFAPPGATEFTSNQLDLPWIDAGQQRYVASTVTGPGTAFWNAGVLGVRNLPGSGLVVASFDNEASGQLLNSGSFKVIGDFRNAGLVKNRAGADFISSGRFLNDAGARFENRGALVNASGGRLTNRGQLVLIGELRDISAGDATGTPTVLNEGGHFDIQATGRLLGQGEYEQRGAAAVTHVDGQLQARSVLISEGSLTGSGRIEGSLSLSEGARLAPGNSVGMLKVDGDLSLFGGEVLIELASATSFDQLAVSGNAALTGRVSFRLLDGYVPAIGDRWTWVTGGSSISVGMTWQVQVQTAQGFALLADADGLYLQGLLPANSHFEFGGDQLSLVQSPVPEPTSWLLWLSALGLWAGRRISAGRR